MNSKSHLIVSALILSTFSLFMWLHSQAQSQPINPNTELRFTKVKNFAAYFGGFFSPDGTRLALAGEHRISIVKVPSGDEVCEIKIETDFVSALEFAPDGQTLAIDYSVFNSKTDKSTRTFLLIDTLTCKNRRVIAQEVASSDDNRSFSFSPDGRYLVANMNSVRMWDVVLGTEVFRQEPGNKFNPKHSRLTPNGKWIISYSSKFVAPNTFHLFTATDVETKKIVEISEEKNIGFTFSDDSNLLFVNSTYHFGEGEARTTKTKIKVYKVGTWELVRTYDDTYSTVHFDVSTKRQLMVSGAMDGKFRVFSLESGKLIGEEYYYKRIPLDDFLRTPHITSFVGPVEFSPDGTMLMTAGARGNVILWKLEFDVNPK